MPSSGGAAAGERRLSLTLRIDGMMCQKNCAATVQRALRAVPGVRSATASFKAANAVVVGSAPAELLVEAVEAAGYAVLGHAPTTESAPAAPQPPAAKQAKQPKAKKSLHLVSDEGFAWRFPLNLLAITAALTLGYLHEPTRYAAEDAYLWTKMKMMRGAHKMAWWSVLGLLSSS